MEESIHISPNARDDKEEIMSSTSDPKSVPDDKESKFILEAEEEWFNFVLY